MGAVRWLVLGAGWCAGCPYISASEQAARLDTDGDGVLPPLDCDDDDPLIGTARSFWLDEDGDHHGGASASRQGCHAPPGYAPTRDDCDDQDATAYPGAQEIVGDALDQDCDGAVLCWADGDRDGSGSASPVEDDGDGACEAADGEASVQGDCADGDPDIHRAALEVCDGLDNDCDGQTDEACETAPPDEELEESPSELPPEGDRDGDGVADALDPCPEHPVSNPADADADGRGDVCDNCPFLANTSQTDSDGDGAGDDCDRHLPGDNDGDGLGNGDENHHDTDKDDPDTDGDGLSDGLEALVLGTDPLEEDSDGGGASDQQEALWGCDPMDPGDDGGC